MDGELDNEDASGVIEQFRNTEGLRDQWAVYHLISDVLEHSEARHLDITQRVSARLAAEPAIREMSSAADASALRLKAKRKPVAYAAAASIAAVVAAGWMSLQTQQAPDALQHNLADNRAVPAAATPALPVGSVPVSAPVQINDYLLAHREFSPSTAMHGVAPYMRVVTETHESLPR